MKKWMNYVVIVGLTAGTASAAWWWPFGDDQREDQAPPPVPEMQKMRRDGMGERPRLQMSPEPMEKMEKMKAQREEIRSIGEAARNETDPVKKEAQVAQLRAKLNEAADQMQADAKKRLEKAEQEIPKLKERMAEFEANRAVRIEEQIKRILAGEPLRGPEGKRPDGAAKREHKKDTPPPAE